MIESTDIVSTSRNGDQIAIFSMSNRRMIFVRECDSEEVGGGASRLRHSENSLTVPGQQEQPAAYAPGSGGELDAASSGSSGPNEERPQPGQQAEPKVEAEGGAGTATTTTRRPQPAGRTEGRTRLPWQF